MGRLFSEMTVLEGKSCSFWLYKPKANHKCIKYSQMAPAVCGLSKMSLSLGLSLGYSPKKGNFWQNWWQKRLQNCFSHIISTWKHVFKADLHFFINRIIFTLYCIHSNCLEILRARVILKNSLSDLFYVADFDENGPF